VEDVNFDQRIYRLGTRKTRDGSMEYEWIPMTNEVLDSLWWCGITVKTATHLSYFLNTTVRTKKGTTGKENSAVIGG